MKKKIVAQSFKKKIKNAKAARDLQIKRAVNELKLPGSALVQICQRL